jgi:small basic protein
LSCAEVEDVVAIAAGGGGLRAVAGGNVACWRVAGAIAALGAVEAAGADGAADLDVVFDAGLAAALSAVFLSAVFLSAVFSAVLGTTLRAIGRGLGRGVFRLAAVSAHACDPMISASVVAIAVERKAVARAERVTAFLSQRITKDHCRIV